MRVWKAALKHSSPEWEVRNEADETPSEEMVSLCPHNGWALAAKPDLGAIRDRMQPSNGWRQTWKKVKKHQLSVKRNIQAVPTAKQNAWNARKHWVTQVDPNRRIQNMSGFLKGFSCQDLLEPLPSQHLVDAFKVQLKLRQLSIVVKPAFKVKLTCVPSIPAI